MSLSSEGCSGRVPCPARAPALLGEALDPLDPHSGAVTPPQGGILQEPELSLAGPFLQLHFVVSTPRFAAPLDHLEVCSGSGWLSHRIPASWLPQELSFSFLLIPIYGGGS